MLLDTLLTAGSRTQIWAPTLSIDEEARDRIPENIDIIMIIKKTANVTPINKAENLPLSLVSNFKASLKMPNTVEPQSD